jgi:predicted DNA-binding transcriptional regulator AlpA
MTTTTPTAPVTPMLLDAKAAARLCGGISVRTWWSLHASGRCPLPVRLGRRTLWRADELAAWIKASCPARDRWHAMRGGRP